MMQLLQSLRILPRWIIIIIDLLILSFSISVGYLLRFNFEIAYITVEEFSSGLFIYLISNLVAIFIMQSYAGIIRYTSIQDGLRIFFTTSLGTLIAFIINYVCLTTIGAFIIPTSVLIISYFTAVIFLFAYRLLVKYIFSYYSGVVQKRKRAAIFGAGQSGLITKQIIEHDTASHIKIAAFLEDDPRKINKIISGVKIYKAKQDLAALFKGLKVSELIIAIQDLPLKRKNEIVDICLKNHIKVRTVPHADKWVKGELSLNQIKDIHIEDLLGRESIKLNNVNVKNEIKGKCILITGAAGSIGGEIVRQVLTYAPNTVILFDQAETPLYEIEREVNHNQNVNIFTIVGDVTNHARLNNLFLKYHPDIVFHAAAYKHVPMMEDNPSEAILCNVLGTKNLADLSLKYQIDKFVLISTDKAVNPTNVMGASKRIAEIYVQSLNNLFKKNDQTITSYITTRFGNVLGSNGSVIPLFKKQIEKRENITVTHPEVTRYFMTIPEACQLVMEAGAMGNGGEIFIFDMGRSIKIVDLAKKMIQLSGLELGKDILIEYTGLRAGEKLYEELLNNAENTLPTHHSKIMVAKVREANFDVIKEQIQRLIKAASERDELSLVKIMKEIVPEFISQYSRFELLDKEQESLNI